MKLERAVGKTKSWKLLCWKVLNEIEKNEVGKFGPKLEKFLLLSTALKTFQLRLVLSNLNGNFPTSRFFQLPFLSGQCMILTLLN